MQSIIQKKKKFVVGCITLYDDDMKIKRYNSIHIHNNLLDRYVYI